MEASVCGICRRPIEVDASVDIDHITPRPKGGTNDAANLQRAHRYCNRARGNRPLAEQGGWVIVPSAERTIRLSQRITPRDKELLEALSRKMRRSMAMVLTLAIEELAQKEGVHVGSNPSKTTPGTNT